MTHRIPEGFRGLAREVAPRQISDGPRDHNGQFNAQFVKYLLHSKARRLGIQSIEDRFDQQHIRPALDQALRLLRVGIDKRVERYIAKAGIVHIGRYGGRPVGRPHGASNKSWLLRRLRRPRVSRGTGKFRRFDVQLICQVLHPIIGLRDRGTVERVRFQDVRTG